MPEALSIEPAGFLVSAKRLWIFCCVLFCFVLPGPQAVFSA